MIGRLNMFVEPGTVMGPTRNGELVTAYLPLPRAEGYEGPDATAFRHAQTKDFYSITEPRSVTEHLMMGIQQSIFGPVRCDLIEYHHPKDVGKTYGGEILTAKRVRPEDIKIGRGENGSGVYKGPGITAYRAVNP